ncbi:MAG TPA: peptidase S41, partial [Desulfobacteraceae bacterium]|nr:peptidase S41 [Desulfobacteraceae bacterium]
LGDGFGIKYTIARYYTPKGRSIQAKGIVPDIEVNQGTVVKRDPDASAFDRMMKERNLTNSLKPEGQESADTKPKSETKSRKDKEVETLNQDAQVKRALDILISYGIFSKLNGS